MSIRERINFIPHNMKEWNDPALASQGITNLVHESDNPDEQWVVDITKKIGDWRSNRGNQEILANISSRNCPTLFSQ